MHPSKPIILTIIIACQLIVVLDASIMVTAMPEIGRSLHMSTTSLTWVQNCYILAFGGFLLLGARAGDLLGRRKMLVVGVGLFSLTSLIAGLAPTAEWLLISRAFQGFAAALATPAALALLSENFVEAKERTRAIAMYSAVSAAGGSIGLLLGGFLTDFISWRAGMLINVPIGIALLLLVNRFIRPTATRIGRFDLGGAMTSVIGMTALVYGFVQAADRGWENFGTWTWLTAGLVALAAFFWIEARVAEPIVPLRLFANRTRSIAYLGRFLLVCSNFSLFFFIPQYLQNVLDYNSLQAGLAFLPFTGAQFAMMYVIPGLIRRYGNKRVLTAGLLLAVLGTLSLSRTVSSQAEFFPLMFVLLSLMGIGSGMAFQPLTSMGLSDVDPRDAGAASGLVNVAHQSGSSLGLAVLVTVFHSSLDTDAPSKLQFAHGVSVSMIGSVVFLIAALAAVLASFLPAKQAIRETATVMDD